MSIPTNMSSLLGNWAGLNHLWLTPAESARLSDTTATITFTAQGKFLSIRYTWAYEGQPQDGLLLVGREAQQNLFKSVWIDSWHTQDSFMLCQGSLDSQGSLSLLGSYPAPPGPDWGWRIVIGPGDSNSLLITMLNISPDGMEHRAVEALYHAKPKLEILPYQSRWPAEFTEIAKILRQGLGDLALCIDHIGSTSVPGLAAKDIIDIQITVADLDQHFLSAMQTLGYTFREGIWRDHQPAGMEGPETDWEKWYFREPAGQRRTHTHVRVIGSANQRYPLLFRDYLRAHPATAESYAELKRRLAKELANPLTYPDVKDPAVDLIYLAAEEWAAATRWQPGPSDG